MEICIKWTMCRTCTSDKSSQLHPLFDDIELSCQLQEYAGITVKPDDGLPDQICVECINNLSVTHAFLSGCKRADEDLRNVVRRTMSSGKYFHGNASDSVESNKNPTKPVSEARARKQIISERKHTIPQQERSLLMVAEEEELSNQELIIKDEHQLSSEEGDTEVLSIGSARATGKSLPLAKAKKQADKNDEDYLLVVSKCVLNVNNGEARDSDGNEYIITDVVDSNDDIDDSIHIEDDSYVSEVTQPEVVEHLALVDKSQKFEEVSDLATEVQTIDLGAACETLTFPKHSCTMCGNWFPNHAQLKSHLRTHRNEKHYDCELCGKSFNAACNLTTHIRTHTGEKPYECTHCGRRFADRSTHRKHERMHTNERPYACNICSKTFSLSTTLKAHSLSHSKEKPHKCLTCNKGFRLPHQLKAHKRTHVHRYEVGVIIDNQDEHDYSSS